ncbi:hypothetical protein BJX61DRAFT_261859 [Aspergillus egyptiacus]|nr:hypothetical protein BJX61DRAFT_261859 [Aspergillus egyptiacus]
MDSYQPQSRLGFRSRRSYPSLNQASISPLTPRYPIDDDNIDNDNTPNAGLQDYFSPRNEALDTPTRTSYLSSFSVPGTPGVLSRTPSRSGSRPRHHTRSKSSTPIHLSDSNLQEQKATQPLHHQVKASGRSRRSAARHQDTDTKDPEWMLRAGIALATSAREEKGQSWLVKRESSTSLVSEGAKYEVDAISQALRRRSRSGRTTPAAAASRSRAASRRNSRPDLAMTSLEMTMALPLSSASKRSSLHGGSAPQTPHSNEARSRSSLSLLPDFIDEQVRAEMRDSIQNFETGHESAISEEDWDYSYSYSEDEGEEIDERELQRLTRERGFGLGSWVDRMVEWTLFGVDDWPLSAADTVASAPPPEPYGDYEDNQPAKEMSDTETDDAQSLASDTYSEISTIERAGDHGGWEDAGWFFRAVRRALIST